MDSIVKLRLVNSGVIKEFPFIHAQAILKADKYNDFECADDKHQFINNELIKRPSNKGGKKSKKSKPDSEGKEVPE